MQAAVWLRIWFIHTGAGPNWGKGQRLLSAIVVCPWDWFTVASPNIVPKLLAAIEIAVIVIA